ncbi:MAG: response regulator [Bdellovibrionales bacterium]
MSAVKWVLLVDDEKEILELGSTYLELQFGDKLKIIHAADGIEATGKIRNQAYDCIVTDLRMPRKEGAAFIEAIYQSALNQKTPVIIHTAHKDPILMESYPMCTLIEKPAPPEAIHQAVATQLKLGRTDRRVGAHLLNMMVRATGKLLEKVVPSGHQVETARVKRKGEEFGKDLTRFISCRLGRQTADFAFNFPLQLIQDLDEASTPGVNHDPEKVLVAATNTILSTASRLLGPDAVNVAKSLVFSKSSQEPPETKARKGIIIPIKTDKGIVELLAAC